MKKIQCGWYVITDNEYHKESSGSACLYPEISNGNLFQFDHFTSYNYEFIRGRETKTGKWILVKQFSYPKKEFVSKVNVCPILYEMLLTIKLRYKNMQKFVQGYFNSILVLNIC